MSIWELRQWIEQSLPAWALLIPIGVVIGFAGAVWLFKKAVKLPW
jgi:hypothetical protein